MGLDLLLLLAGLGVLLGGGEALVRGASAVARAAGVSTLVVGLTVVALGTSAPELAVNLTAALRAQEAISFGNIVGSNLANLGVVIGLAAALRPLSTRGVVLSREIPMMMLATLAALVLGVDRLLGGGSDRFERGDGLVLLLLLSVFVYYTLADLRRPSGIEPLVERAGALESERFRAGRMASLGLCALGSIGLVAGGQLAVTGAVGLAQALGVPEVVIGMTLVAFGTSLPELASSVIAVYRGETDLAVGNVVGSNILNLLLIGGVCASLRPIPVPVGGERDLIVMALLTLLFWALAATPGRSIIRAEGALLFVVYLGYVVSRVCCA